MDHVEVTGKVLYKGKPLSGGQVTFITVIGGFASTGVIDENGNYKIQAPAGEVKIGVDNRMLSRQSAAATHEAARKGAGRPEQPEPNPIKGTYVLIPEKYYSVETSGLTYTVTKGPQTHDIELKD